jgi:hypothetical protein
MIRPVGFLKNEQTAVNNFYQKDIKLSSEDAQTEALREFDGFVEKLRAVNVNVMVVKDSIEPSTPDSIFPNNWVSFHEDGSVMLYPMFAENRRMERRDHILDRIGEEFSINKIDDSLIRWEDQGKYLEGTGSLILDRVNKIAYAAISERTNAEVLADFKKKTGFQVVSFGAYQTVNNNRLPIYHTNVMMFVGEAVAVICLDCIDDGTERINVQESLKNSGKEVVVISEDQVLHFAGNMLQVRNGSGKRFVVMSTVALNCLDDDQTKTLEKHGELLHSDLDIIETLGGGSARCMMAEVFLPMKIRK